MFIFVFADKDLQVYSTLYILKRWRWSTNSRVPSKKIYCSVLIKI